MSEQNLPIDIQCRKLLDWLISRRICNREWHNKIRPIREKIGKALLDMPEHPGIGNLLAGANINYFICLEIVEILKETEADTKNFFGGYRSQRMTDWKQVISDYGRENVYLAEAAQLLVQVAAYDVPATKKQIAKLIQVQEECDKRINDNGKRAEEFNADYSRSCKNLGIEGVAIRKEIIELLRDLPTIYKDLAENSKSLSKYRDSYLDYIRGVHSLNCDKEVLPNLAFLIERGNVTTYEWVHGEPPLTIVESQINFEDEEEDNDEKPVENAKIDFDMGEEIELDAPAEIDWDDLDVSVTNQDNADIDWDVVDGANANFSVEDSGVEGGVARESDALTILDNKRTRALILDELHELQAFVEQRQLELINMESGKSLSLTIEAGDMNYEKLEEAKKEIRAFIGSLSTGKLHHLQLVRDSPKYVDRLVDGLKQKTRLSKRAELAIEEQKAKKAAALKEETELQSRLKTMIEKTKMQQNNIESDISKRYQGRKVNIMGGIKAM